MRTALRLVLPVLLLTAAPVAAQVRAGHFATLNTLDTSADSLHVGCAVGSSSCTGGIKAGTASITTLTAVLSDTAFGAHLISAGGTGSNTLTIRNTTAGTGNYSALFLGNNADATNVFLQSFSSTFTTAGPNVAAGGLLAAENAGGLSVGATGGGGALRFYAGGTTQRWGINAAGDFTYGPTAIISDSVGTPTITSGAGGAGVAIVGQDYAFTVVLGAAPSTTVVVAFGHTWISSPVCMASSSLGAAAVTATRTGTSTTSATIVLGSAGAGQFVNVLCRGF